MNRIVVYQSMWRLTILQFSGKREREPAGHRRDWCRAPEMTETPIEIGREAHLESAGIVLGFELNKIETFLIRVARYVSAESPLCGERLPYRRSLGSVI